MPRTASLKQTLTIRVDTREQDPFTFDCVAKPVLPFTVVRGTLKTGDYADDGRCSLPPAEQCIVERKSLPDLYSTMARGRGRFERECQRLAEFGYAAIVIEADWHGILRPNEHLQHATKMSPKSVVAGLLAFGQRYGLHVFPCPGRRFAEQLTHRLLERWARDHLQEIDHGTPADPLVSHR